MGNNDKPLGMSGGVPAGELLPCPNPWCERIEGVEASRHLVTERWHVCCDDCMIEGPWAKTYDEAVAAWNTRATPTPPIEGRDADVEQLKQALEDVCNPLAYLKRMAEAEGAKLGGMAYSIANDIATVQGIARAALQALGERP